MNPHSTLILWMIFQSNNQNIKREPPVTVEDESQSGKIMDGNLKRPRKIHIHQQHCGVEKDYTGVQIGVSLSFILLIFMILFI